MALPPFKVKAIYAYTSDHSEDLNFPQDTVITVTEEEDADWYVGEYISEAGVSKSGLFPKNFVEKYEPAPPPRPTRAARPKPTEQEEAPAPSIPVVSKPKVEETKAAEPEPVIEPEPEPEPEPAPKPAPAPVAREEPPAAPKSEKSVPVKGPPPPVASKSSSFKDRLAAFNNPGAAPVTPFKPGGSSSNTFIKKPYVAPPPSRNAYVPPVREQPAAKIYRREEDPEIAQRQAEDEQAAEKAGLVGHADAGEGDEDAPKPVSLKERIALLQRQQREQAERRVDPTPKKKPERPPKKRTESHEAEDAAGASANPDVAERATRESSDVPRDVPVRKPSRPPAVPRAEVSDGNEADHSAAGETTEDAGHDSSTEEEAEPARHNKAPVAQPDVGDEEDDTEEAEEGDEMDEEARRQQALRERMAKLSGGMGMGPMFGMGPPGGMAMPGMSGAPPAKKKRPTTERKVTDDDVPSPAARAPMVPIPGMGLPGMVRSMSNESEATIGKEVEDEQRHPITGERGPNEVPDIEDVKQKSPTSRAVPPLPPQDRPVPQSAQLPDRGAPPPVPGGRPPTEARAIPAPPPQSTLSPTEGSESDDEMPEELPIRGPPPNLPQIPPRSSMDREPNTPTSPSDKRMSRMGPPVPIASPTMAPLGVTGHAARAPPPPPPTGAPPSRQGTTGSMHRRALGSGELEGSEYEGDYDTDIAPGAHHKEALKSHARDSSLEESLSTDTPVRSPPIPQSSFSPTAARAVPPLPPTQPPGRESGETPRTAPPPVPSHAGGNEDDDDYDPYKYTGVPAVRSPLPAPSQAPRPPPAPPSMPPTPRVPTQPEEESSEEEDDLYSAPPPRRSTEQQPRKSSDRAPPPLPPQAPPSHDRAPPPLPPQAPPPAHAHFDAPAPPSAKAPGRPSMDKERSFGPPSRVSTDPTNRPSMSGHRPDIGDFIAREIDLAEDSQWWSKTNTPPPSIQNRSDVSYEIEESQDKARGAISKDVYILYQDYSQTVINVLYDATNPAEVALEQRQEPPPPKLRQDQLENWWTRFGASIAKTTSSSVGGAALGDGSAHGFILELLKGTRGALAPVGTRSYGALVYANLGNATVTQYDEIRAGDCVSFRNARFSGKHGGLHTKYSLEVGAHVGVVVEWDGTKKKLRVAEQGRDMGGGAGKEKKKKGKVEVESYRLEDLRSGEVRVWRVVGRGFVGWEEA